MPWSGGSYTKGNSGTGGWAGDAAAGIGIEAGRHDTQDNDFATGINQCLNKDGTNSITANLNFGGYLPANVGAGTAGAPAFCAGNDVNTGAFGPAADTYAISTGGTERLRVNNSGQLGVGTTSPGVFVDLQSTSSVVNQTQFSANTNGAELNLRKSRGASVDTNTIVVNGDTAGVIQFYGANGTGYDRCAYIGALINGVPGASADMPGALVFGTTPDGSSTTSERMRIESNGSVNVGTSGFTTTRLGVQGADTGTTNYSVFVRNSASTTLFAIRNDGQMNVGVGAASPYNNTTASAANAFLASGGDLQRSTSSIRYKSDIQTASFGLTDVLNLRPVTYKGKNDGDKIFGGLIAEEVDAAGLSCFVQYDDQNQPDALAYGNMVALAFAAIKELNAKVEALEARVTELEP